MYDYDRPEMDEEKWAKARIMYEGGQKPADIMRLFGCPSSTFYRRRDRERWATPQKPARRNTRPAAPTLSNDQGKRESGTGERLPVAPQPSQVPDAGQRAVVTTAHLRQAETLRQEIDRVLALEGYGADKRDRPSRTISELVQALERVQKIERLALRMDDPTAKAATQVVIVVPGKASEEEWEAKAIELRQGAGYDVE